MDVSENTPEDIERENHRRLVAWFAEGAAGASAGGASCDAGADAGAAEVADESKTLGVEVEHFIVTDEGAPIGYERGDNPLGVRDVLEHLSQHYPEQTRNAQGDLLGLANETGSVTLEPAAQIEISLAPCHRIADVERNYLAFRNVLDPFLAQAGCRIAEAGYHPTARALDLKLIPKERYDFMNEHFKRIKTHGERMMRASASTQVSVDFADEADAVRKLRIATALGPVIAAITDNVLVFEGEATTTPLERMRLWRDVDNARCGVVPGTFDEGFGFDAYARWLENVSPICVTRPAASNPDGPARRGVGDTPARIAYNDAPMDAHDIEHLVSMVWPDARLKRFVEIRPGDCMPAACVFGYAALVKGLFYCPANLDATEKLIGVRNGAWPLDDGSVDRAIESIRADGLEGDVYGHTLASWEEALFELAAADLDDDERPYLDALRAFAADKPWI